MDLPTPSGAVQLGLGSRTIAKKPKPVLLNAAFSTAGPVPVIAAITSVKTDSRNRTWKNIKSEQSSTPTTTSPTAILIATPSAATASSTSTSTTPSTTTTGSGSTGVSSLGTRHIVRLYVGYEYECRDGHRFIASSSERTPQLFTGHSTSIPLTSPRFDLPLVVPCQCVDHVSPGGMEAYLVRVYFAVPNVGFKFELQPRLLLDVAAHLVLESPSIEIEADGVYVLVLPRVFMHNSRVFIPSSSSQSFFTKEPLKIS